MIEIAARARNIEEGLACVELGYKKLEITMPCPGGAVEEQAWAELRDQKGVFFLGHGPKEGDPSDLKHLEKNYLPQLGEAAEVCRRLGGFCLTVHLWLEPRFLPPAVIEGKIALLDRAVDWARKCDVDVNLENLSENWKDLSSALAAVPKLGLTLDVGHAQLLHPENTSFGIIEHLFSRIRHLHFHDNHGGKSPRDDLHLIPGNGKVPFREILSRLKKMDYDKIATLELYPGELEQGRSWLNRIWAQI